MIRVRKENHAFGWGDWQIVETQSADVLAHRLDWENKTVVVLHNLSDEAKEVKLDLADKKNTVEHELVSDAAYDTPKSPTEPIRIGPYGFRWFRL